MFCKKGVLKNFAKFTGKHLCQSLFLIKLQALRTPFFIEQRWWLLLFSRNNSISEKVGLSILWILKNLSANNFLQNYATESNFSKAYLKSRIRDPGLLVWPETWEPGPSLRVNQDPKHGILKVGPETWDPTHGSDLRPGTLMISENRDSKQTCGTWNARTMIQMNLIKYPWKYLQSCNKMTTAL